MDLIVKVSFAGKGFHYIASDEPQRVPKDVAEMALNAGFAVKPAKKTTTRRKGE